MKEYPVEKMMQDAKITQIMKEQIKYSEMLLHLS